MKTKTKYYSMPALNEIMSFKKYVALKKPFNLNM